MSGHCAFRTEGLLTRATGVIVGPHDNDLAAWAAWVIASRMYVMGGGSATEKRDENREKETEHVRISMGKSNEGGVVGRKVPIYKPTVLLRRALGPEITIVTPTGAACG